MAGGVESRPQCLAGLIGDFDFAVAADGGWRLLKELEFTCSHLVGDFDTLSPMEVESARAEGTLVKSFPKDKSQSDLELALEKAFELGAGRVTIIGALGGQWDHCVVNLLAPLSLCSARGVWGRILSSEAQIFLVNCSVCVNSSGSRVSVASLSAETCGLTLTGFEYPLNKAKLKRSQTLGLANRVTSGEAVVELEQGELLLTLLPAGEPEK